MKKQEVTILIFA